MMELIMGIVFGMTIGQYVLIWRIMRRVTLLEDRVRRAEVARR